MPHLVVAFILILMPVISIFEVKKLKANIADKTKESAYLRIYLWYILATVLVLMVQPFASMFYPAATFTVPKIINYILWSIVTYQLFMLIVPTILTLYSQRMRSAIAEEYRNKEYMLPRSKKSLIMFAVLAFVVGISEEIIFRGYLYSYFQGQWGFTALSSFIITNVLFGIGHYQQGKSAIWDTMLFGFALSWLYINSGSLLLPIIFHILYDLKIVWVTLMIRKELRA
ncbi:CPBP family intramembrane glutamic endopeptidase [Paenibacillus sp. EPM92]|uniref:CPBP family intramembrane glutamic endopeptidase n=1 Tax=Paenibacillus sp. EPM92 TaxID=1561195 RepID=UPI0019156ADB|nr:type II CAAX endopeptidase family protein [Paenibacillus sp. EPM92]